MKQHLMIIILILEEISLDLLLLGGRLSFMVKFEFIQRHISIPFGIMAKKARNHNYKFGIIIGFDDPNNGTRHEFYCPSLKDGMGETKINEVSTQIRSFSDYHDHVYTIPFKGDDKSFGYSTFPFSDTRNYSCTDLGIYSYEVNQFRYKGAIYYDEY